MDITNDLHRVRLKLFNKLGTGHLVDGNHSRSPQLLALFLLDIPEQLELF
jgi:hypothetical protein